jgi:WD40 repeat protein
VPGLAAIDRDPGFVEQRAWRLDDAVADLSWSLDGDALLAGSAAGSLYRLVDDVTRPRPWQAHSGGVTRVLPSPVDGDLVATAGEDGRVALWDVDTGRLQTLLCDGDSWVEHLAWTPDGRVLASAARRTISLWRDASALGVWYDARRQVLAMAWAPDGRRLATAANKGLYLWRMDAADDAGAEPMRLLSFPGAPVALAWRGNGKALAVGTQDGFLQVWCTSTGRKGPAGGGKGNGGQGRQLTMRGYRAKVSCLAWHPRRALIATAGGNDVVLWDIPETGKGAKGQPLRHHAHTITALGWSADGDYLASGDRAGHLCIRDRDGDPVFSRRLGDEISGLAWHPSGTALAVGNTDGDLYLFRRPGAPPPHDQADSLPGDQR